MAYTNILFGDNSESLPFAQLLATPQIISVQRGIEEIAHLGDNRLCFSDHRRVATGAEGAGFDSLATVSVIFGP